MITCFMNNSYNIIINPVSYTHLTRIFYCDPMASGQKGSLENNHKEIRYICPKENDLNDLVLNSQEKANLIVSHINLSLIHI